MDNAEKHEILTNIVEQLYTSSCAALNARTFMNTEMWTVDDLKTVGEDYVELFKLSMQIGEIKKRFGNRLRNLEQIMEDK